MMSVFAIGSVISVLMYLLSFAALVLFVIAIVFYVKSDKAGNRKSLFIASVILYSLTLAVWIAGSVVVGAMTGRMMYASVTEADVVRLSVTSIIFNGLRTLLNIASVVVSILSMVKSRKFAAAKAAPGVNRARRSGAAGVSERTRLRSGPPDQPQRALRSAPGLHGRRALRRSRRPVRAGFPRRGISGPRAFLSPPRKTEPEVPAARRGLFCPRPPNSPVRRGENSVFSVRTAENSPLRLEQVSSIETPRGLFFHIFPPINVRVRRTL